MSFFDLSEIPPWASDMYGASKPQKSTFKVPERRKYEIFWEVPFGTRKLWVPGMKAATLIRHYLYGGDAVFNISIRRLEERLIIPTAIGHRHWVNDIEFEHSWETCDINPKNFLFFT